MELLKRKRGGFWQNYGAFEKETSGLLKGTMGAFGGTMELLKRKRGGF